MVSLTTTLVSDSAPASDTVMSHWRVSPGLMRPSPATSLLMVTLFATISAVDGTTVIPRSSAVPPGGATAGFCPYAAVIVVPSVV